MPTVQTAGQLARLEDRDPFSLHTRSLAGSSLSLYNGRRQSYAQIVRTQPNVRTVISFLARNVAQLGVQLFERRSETDRQRLWDHPFAEGLRRPNPADRRMTTYRLMHRTVWDICAFDSAFWGLFPIEGLGRPIIQPLRPDRLEIEGHLWPTGYLYHLGSGTIRLEPTQVVNFQASHNLDDPLWGTSPIETLRRIIAEDDAAGIFREQFWRSGARVSGVIERPPTAADWSKPARDRFKEDWDGVYTGHGEKAGGTPILEDGMVFKEAGTVNARSAQYIDARKLSREEAAASYHVDPIWVGIASAGLSFSSVVERHKALYQDTLGPWVTMLEQDLTYQALPAFEEDPEALDRLYTKLNIAEKLRGSTEDLADAISKLTGRPILTANEARGLIERNDLPEGEGLALPLNTTIVGGDLDPAPDGGAAGSTAAAVVASSAPALGRGFKAGISTTQHEALGTEHVEAHRLALVSHFNRQRRAIAAAYGDLGGTNDVDDVFDAPRWNAELESDLLGLALDLADAYGVTVAEALAFEDLDVDAFVPWLAENARIAAENLNVTTRDLVAAALIEEEPLVAVGEVFATATGTRAETAALTRYTAVAAFVAQDTAAQAGRSSKVWNVTSSQSRHPELDGETVPIGEPFSNGMAYPGDAGGGADQTAGCTCLLSFE